MTEVGRFSATSVQATHTIFTAVVDDTVSAEETGCEHTEHTLIPDWEPGVGGWALDVTKVRLRSGVGVEPETTSGILLDIVDRSRG